MKSDEVWSFDGFPWMQSGGPSYHCQRRSQQLMIDHHWLWLHIPTVSPYWMVEACCIFSPRVLLFFLPALSEAENLWSTWHVRSCQSPSCSTFGRSISFEEVEEGEHWPQGHLLQMPKKTIKMAMKGGVLYFETNPSFMLLAIHILYIYIYYTYYTHTHIISNYISIIRNYIPATSPSKWLKQNQPTYFWLFLVIKPCFFIYLSKMFPIFLLVKPLWEKLRGSPSLRAPLVPGARGLGYYRRWWVWLSHFLWQNWRLMQL